MIGRSPARKDAREKIVGATRYIADYPLPGVWHGVALRSALPAGRLRRITAGPGFPDGAAVLVTGRELGDANRVAMVTDEMPFLAADDVRYAGEPLALIAAPTLQAARLAAREVRVEIEPQPALLTLAEAERRWRADPASVPIHAEYRIRRGDAAAALEAAPLVVAGTYTTQAQEQAYIEPQGVIAWPGERGGAIIEGSLQCPYYVHNALVRLLGCAPEDLIVRQSPTGGAFGGKEDFPSVLAGHAALLARACGQPVRIVYDRHEDLLFTPKRHPSTVHHRTGVSRDGRLLGMQITVLLDGGAYTTLSPVVLSRAVLHATGPYECPDVEIHGVCLGTNIPPPGAFRGFGAPQIAFAVESHIDRIAERCDLRPDELRRRNLLRPGSVTATGQTLRESVSTEKVLDAALAASDFARRWEANRAAPAGRQRRGIGLALTWHGGGFTGSGEVYLASLAALTIEADGRLLIRVANVEMGQGAHTSLPQIVAAKLGVPLERVACVRPDTAQVPNSGPTVASRTVMVVGRLVERCAEQLLAALVAHAGPRAGWRDFDAALDALRTAGGPLRFEARYQKPPGIQWDDKAYRGDAYAVYSYACTVVEVVTDVETGEVEIERVVAACDIGRAIHPQVVEGQIEGGVLQGLGFGLLEQSSLDGGFFAQNRFQTYIIPTALDAPPIVPLIVENPYAEGPGGAKGLGELPLHGPAPALAGAVAQASGRRVMDLPVTPERIVAAAADAGDGRARR
jgi:CO/xanthine dehydrogenase Mo-binding subunit